MHLRYGFILIFGLLCYANSTAQDHSVHEHIQQIEQESDFIFNYDVADVSDRFLSYDWKGDYSTENIKSFFHNTAFDIQINWRTDHCSSFRNEGLPSNGCVTIF